uniref:G domain-containing protein n=1 Tax=Physcomitrium patens TaxID=3218 RepID=A0A7I4AYV9_PHYPA
MASNKKVILFGKTGSGKSTVSNALVTNGLEQVVFQSSAGFSGCTWAIQTGAGKGWEVIDTVGLGESSAGKWVRLLGRDRILVTDIPPIDQDSEAEEDIRPIRQDAIKRLEENLTRLFIDRGSLYFTPHIASMSESSLMETARSILDFITEMSRAAVNAFSDALGIRDYRKIMQVILSIFK